MPDPRTATDVVRRFVDAMGQDVDAMADCLSDDFLRYGPETAGAPMTKAAYLRMAENYRTPFPDCRWEIDDLIAADDRVAIQMRESATFTQAWPVGAVTLPPNGVRYEMAGSVFFTVDEDGRISTYTYIHDGAFVSVYADTMTDDFLVAYVDEFMTTGD